MKRIIQLLASIAVSTASAADPEPNPPTWVDNVKYFKADGNMTEYQTILDAIHKD